MSEWLEAIANYIEKKEGAPAPLVELSEEIGLGILETERLFQRAQEVQSAITACIEKMDHANT